MVMQLYSIYDHLAEEFGPVFESKNDATATRSFDSVVKDKVTKIEEYSLFKIGSFNHDNGEFDFGNSEIPVVGKRIEKNE